MKNLLLGITTAALLFTACNNSSKPEKDASLTSPSTETSTTPVVENNVPQESINNQIQPMPSTITPGAVTASLNPEHGQPNHRCDIPVGAPLNSPAPAATTAPATNSTMPAAVQPSMAKPILPATTGASSGKINPPHGEPGHSCAIAVGAQLP